MNKIILDTNCLISFVSDRNPSQQEEISLLFSQARSLKKSLICHHHVISEFVYVLTNVYALEPKDVQKMIAELISMPGITYTSEVDIKMLLSLWPERIPDYGDAVIAAYCKKSKGSCIASFDKKFINALIKIGLPIQPM